MNSLLAAGSIVLGSPGWSGFVLIVGVIFFLTLLVAAIRSPLPPRWKWLLFSLKAAAIILLALCLLDPLVTRSRAVPGENIVVLLADQSASMEIRPAGPSSQTHGEFAKRVLDGNQPWLTRFAQDFDVRSYTFGSGLKRVENFETLQFETPASHLGHALTGLKERFARQSLAGIVLFTDGNSTDALPASLEDLRIPVFPVVSRSSSPVSDLSIRNVSVSQSNFEDAPVTVTASIQFTGPRPERVTVTLRPWNAGEQPAVQTQTLSVDRENDLAVRFQLKPHRPGALFYQLQVRNEKEPEAFEKPETSREATLANNRRLIAVNRDTHISRILYVGGRPNWEHKFLNRALSSDPQLQLVSLIRIARKESKFDFRGRIGESSNSLFRGFKSQADEETEDYSQPVLIRLNARDGEELSGGFPQSKAKLYEYDAIILDDVESAFFTHDQQVLIDQFVSERGGGLLMLGGIDSFRSGKWNQTPVADTLPVYLNRQASGPGGEIAWGLTKEGWVENWVRLRETEQAEQNRLRNAPPLSVVSATSQVKPGARVLAEAIGENGKRFPAIVVQQYGNGRAGAYLAGDTWRWALRAEDAATDDLGKSWRQTARWLVGDVPQRMTIVAAPATNPEQPATQIQVRLRDPEFQPDHQQRVTVRVRQPDGAEITLETQPSLNEPGLFETQYYSRQSGAYLAEASVADAASGPSQTKVTGWTSEPAAAEFVKVDVNLPLLQELAQKTKGEVLTEDQLERFASNFTHRDVPATETETNPLWHRPMLLITVILLLAGEWGLRRWRGLA